jgi:hypothetical protein
MPGRRDEDLATATATAAVSPDAAHSPRVFVYILEVDAGYAPNPFHGWCTLACCKPAIRRSARPGDWIVGLTPAADGHCLAYAMKVEGSLPFEAYWADRRFRAKRPNGRSVLAKRGDNCYKPLPTGGFRQLPCCHYDHEHRREDERSKRRDLGGRRVLVARRFCYLGANARPLPAHLTFKRPARYNRVLNTDPERAALLVYLESLPRGVRGRPRQWHADDKSWREGRSRCV